jgi:hypothetical protein
MQDRAEDPRITRARLSGPEQVTRNATVAELGADGTLTVLAKGTNEWVCVPGNENKIGEPPMCMNPMGMLWITTDKRACRQEQVQVVRGSRVLRGPRNESIESLS